MARHTLNIDVTAVDVRRGPWMNPLAAAVRAGLRRHGVRGAHIHLALVSDTLMARLHRDHLGVPGPTDVLTFDLRDPERSAPTAKQKKKTARQRPSRGQLTNIQGEIVISVDTARREARRRRHTMTAELCLYAVHGTLHLLGFDDRAPAAAKRMHQEEDAVLQSLGFGRVYERGR